MKGMLRLAVIYTIAGLSAGVFYREYTKFIDYSGDTALSLLHVHLLTLGTIMSLLVLILMKVFPLSEEKHFKRFRILYNIGLPLTVTMLLIRGIVDTLRDPVSKGIDAAISGVSGLGHMVIGLAFLFLFLSLKNIIE